MDQTKRILDLKARRAALSERLARVEAKQAREERKRLTRQKILIGVAVLRALGTGKMAQESFHRLISENLSSKDLAHFRL
jgi:hypothetical protein